MSTVDSYVNHTYAVSLLYRNSVGSAKEIAGHETNNCNNGQYGDRHYNRQSYYYSLLYSHSFYSFSIAL